MAVGTTHGIGVHLGHGHGAGDLPGHGVHLGHGVGAHHGAGVARLGIPVHRGVGEVLPELGPPVAIVLSIPVWVGPEIIDQVQVDLQVWLHDPEITGRHLPVLSGALPAITETHQFQPVSIPINRMHHPMEITAVIILGVTVTDIV